MIICQIRYLLSRGDIQILQTSDILSSLILLIFHPVLDQWIELSTALGLRCHINLIIQNFYIKCLYDHRFKLDYNNSIIIYIGWNLVWAIKNFSKLVTDHLTWNLTRNILWYVFGNKISDLQLKFMSTHNTQESI